MEIYWDVNSVYLSNENNIDPIAVFLEGVCIFHYQNEKD